MRWALFFAAIAAANPLLPRTACPNNACLHSMLAEATVAASVLLADCSSYFQTTITPPVSTITKVATTQTTGTETMHVYVLTYSTTTVITTGTVTTTQTITASTEIQQSSTSVPALFQRQAAASGLPAYASVCGKADSYGSACACLGVKPLTKTLPAAKTTTTVAAYKTVKTVTYATTDLTVTRAATQTSAETRSTTVPTYIAETAVSFVLQAESVKWPGRFAMVHWNSEASRTDVQVTQDPTQATVFYIDEAGKLINSATGYAAYCYLGNPTAITYDDAATNHAAGLSPASCFVTTDLTLSCSCGPGVSTAAIAWTRSDSLTDIWAWILIPGSWDCKSDGNCVTWHVLAMQ